MKQAVYIHISLMQEGVQLIKEWVNKSPHMHSIKKGLTLFWENNMTVD